MITKSPPRVIAFDGDDTLWHNETVFVITQHEFRALVLRHVDLPYEEIDARLVATERPNLTLCILPPAVR